MATLNKNVTSILKHPVTGIVSGLYLTGVGLTAIKYLNKNKATTKNAAEKVMVLGVFTGIIGTVTLLMGGRTAFKALKSD